MKPVEVEFLLRDKLTPGMKEAGLSADLLKKKMEEQRAVIKRIESDIQSLEKAYRKLSPGKEQLNFKADLDTARKVLQEEIGYLDELAEKYKSAKEVQTTYLTRMRKIREEMAALTSADGTVPQANIQRYTELQTRLSEVGTAYRRVRQEQKLLTTEGSAQLAGVISGISGVAGVFSAAQGVSSLFVRDNEKLAYIQTRLQAVMAITIGLQQTSTALSATSAFRTQTLTKAKTLLTAANTRLAVSLGISNAAATALMATLTLGLSAVVAGLVILWNKYSDAQQEAAKKARERVETESDGRAQMVKTRFEIEHTVKSLKDFTGSKEEEKEMVEQLNRKYGESFGYYDTVGQWYDVLIQKSDAYIQMLFLQAKAQSLVNKAVEADEKANLTESAAPDDVEGAMGWFARMGLYIAQAMDIGRIDARREIEEYNRKAKDAAVKAARDQRNAYLDEAGKLQEEAAALRKKFSLGGFFKPDNREKERISKEADDLIGLERKARKKIEDNTITLIKAGYERQRQEARLAFSREKERIAGEEKQRLELYEKLRRVGHPVTKEQKDEIVTQSARQRVQAEAIYLKTIADINAKEKLETEKKDKVIRDALEKYQTYYQKRLSTLAMFEKERKKLEKGGATQGQYAELEYRQEEALSAIDKEFAMREDSFRIWADSITKLSLEQLRKLLYQARQELERMEFLNPTGNLSSYRQRIAELEKTIAGFNRKNDDTPSEDSFRKWSRLSKVLSRAQKEFKEIGDAVGGTAGEVLSMAGQITASTLSMISSINELANWSVTATKMTAEGVSKTIQAVEKASVILAVISAAIQLIQQLSALIPDAHEEYLRYAEKVNQINILRDAVHEYELAVLAARQAEESWFATDNLNSLKQAREYNEKVLRAYIAKAGEAQAIYKNESGGGWLTGAANWIMGNMSAFSPFDWWRDIWGQGGYDKGQTAAINNLRIETRKKSSGFLGSGIGGKSQKTEDLVTWARNQGLGELFDDKGMIDKELGKEIIAAYGDKLVGQTKETLEALVELREQYDQYLEQLHEYVSSLYEPLVGNFVDSLWDWFDEGKDALDSFKDYASQTFRDIVSDMMRAIVLKNIFGEGENSFQEQLNRLYEGYSSGTIKTETELAAKVSSLTSGLISRFEDALPGLKSIMTTITDSLAKSGIDLKDTEGYNQSGRAGVVTTITQDTGNKLEGIGTSMQMHLANMDDTVENIGSALGDALTSLRRIEEYTGLSSKALGQIKAYMERMLTEGLRMK